MKQKDKYLLMLGMAMAMAKANGKDNGFLSYDDVKRRTNKRVKKSSQNRRKRLLTKGVNEYLYHKIGDDEVTIIILARNKKNADRKARNKGCFVI